MAVLLSYALTTVADVKETLGIDAGNTSKDNLIIRKINQATEMIEGYCSLPQDHHFAQTSYTDEEYDGTGVNQLIIRMRPIVAGETFTLQQRDTALNEDDWTTVNTDYYFVDEKAAVVDAKFTFSEQWNRYRVTYTAGYDTIPFDLAEACATLAAFYVDNATTGTGVKSKEEGQRKIEYFDASSGSGDSDIFNQLNLDEILNRYAYTRIIDDV